jgi:hypothetical protein
MFIGNKLKQMQSVSCFFRSTFILDLYSSQLTSFFRSTSILDLYSSQLTSFFRSTSILDLCSSQLTSFFRSTSILDQEVNWEEYRSKIEVDLKKEVNKGNNKITELRTIL